MESATNNWTELREFAGVDLLNSYVLSWSVVGQTLALDVDVCLKPDHPFYEPPRPAERHCIRAGTLEFAYCDAMHAENVDSQEPRAVAMALGHGKITGLRRVGDGQYELAGPFGKVRIESDRPILRLKDSIY